MRVYLFCFLCYSCMIQCHSKSIDIPVEEQPPATETDTNKTKSILALGDSYTKGQSVVWEQNFPNQLADSLKRLGFKIAGVRIIAQTGWRTDQLLNALQNQNYDIADSVFDLVTLLIGVNNQYQNGKIEQYQTEFESLLQIALARAGGRREHVIVLSIPDYAYTPYGQGSISISQEIDQFNAVNQTITNQYGISYVNITDISRKGIEQPDLVAVDGLHPAAKQYTAWVKRLIPIVKTVF